MAELSDFLPVRIETLDSIIARIDADLNAGLDPEDDNFIDTTPGSFYADIRTAIALELERLWDVATTDTVAASLVDYAWGDYLDAHGETLGIARKDEVRSSGLVTFTRGEVYTDSILLAVGTEVATTQTDPEVESVAFITTEAGVMAEGDSSITLPVEAVEPGAAGNVPTGAVNLLMTGIEEIGSVTNASAITGGSDIESDDAYRERLKLGWSSAQGSGSVADYERWALAYPGVGYVRVTPLWNGPGTVRVVITDVENNPVSDATITGFQNQLDPFSAETSVDGTQTSLPSTGATLTVDSTDGFTTSGKVFVGENFVSYTGVTSTAFQGVSGLPSSVTNGTRVIQHETGRGLAPVGAIVTVDTAETVVMSVSAEVSLREGYSLDGEGGTIAVRPEIVELLTNFVNNLPPGAEPPPGIDDGSGFVLLNRVASLVVRVPGVYDITLSSLLLDGANANFAVGPLEVPELGTITLTEA